MEFLASETAQCVLLLVDGARVAERQVDDLYTLVRSGQLPVVFFQSLRRDQPQEERQRSIYLESELDAAERNRFAVAMSRQVPAKAKELEELSLSTDPRKHTAFYFGLQTFGSDFLGLEPYVHRASVVLERRPAGDRCIHVPGPPLCPEEYPTTGIRDATRRFPNRQIKLDRILPSETLDLLVKVDEDKGGWRPAHELVALEILIQLLIPEGGDRRNWRQRLSVWAEKFAVFCRGDDPVAGEELLEVVRRTFVYRDNRDDLGTERSSSARFAKLIDDIPSHEGQLECLRSLIELYPEEPHFLAHLGRFYYLIQKDYPRALEVIDRAIAQQPEDHVLHHMRGMAVRSQIYEAIQNKKPLLEAVDLARVASASFEEARKLAPDDVHGYISETQMMIRLLDYCGVDRASGMLAYLASKDAAPYLRDALERSEDLLDQVRRNREGEAPDSYEENCRAELDRLHGRTQQGAPSVG